MQWFPKYGTRVDETWEPGIGTIWSNPLSAEIYILSAADNTLMKTAHDACK